MNPEIVNLPPHRFEKSIDRDDIAARVSELGAEIAKDYQGEVPVLLGVLNGSFVFMADLARAIDTPTEVAFIRAKSYDGMESTGKVQIEAPKVMLKDRHVIIVEDIVDKGITLDKVLRTIHAEQPKSIKVATFLKKPQAYLFEHRVDYCGFEIPNDFVVGYGLDYNEHGRGLESLYKLSSTD